jgi:2-oxoglutarate dehydrogenase E1 component
MHIDDFDVRDWLQQRMEGTENRLKLSRDQQVRILTKLTDAVIFEEFVRRKYVGAKTFSLEGAESLIPLLDMALERACEQETKEVVIGMAHRGRLNVLANIMGKRGQNIFWSFDDPDPEVNRGRGDVLYHLGYSSDWYSSNQRKMHISLCFNPSHLEFVNTVAMGRVRSKQDRYQDTDRRDAMTLLIHGDAAFAGEGIVQETLNLSQLAGYRVGGTLHVIVNNQIGFTTPPNEGRSTTYASDVAKMLQIPIFHVNGEDPESVAQVVSLAMDFRKEFKRDVVIDMYCYRRLGHNESDEPRFTQPNMYQTISERPTVREGFLKRLLKRGDITEAEAEEIAERRKRDLEQEFESAQNTKFQSDLQSLTGIWSGYRGGTERKSDDPETGLDAASLQSLITKIATTPDDFNLNEKLVRVFEARREMALGQRDIDWATAELAAFGSLAVQGHPVRMSGQDCCRGTFSQRHAVVYDSSYGDPYCSLQHLAKDQADVDIINSPLSEAGVIGFEYGYSLDYPEALILWEAQFGDFWNAGQVIMDQFISSAEDKWRRLSGLVLLLPHGFEGAGPEHCSARIERILMLTAEHNIQICIPTTAAQHFHLLRRQVLRKWRKPLVVLTPKGLLREPLVASPQAAFTSGRFQRLISDPILESGLQPDRILMATGKVAVDLMKRRAESPDQSTAIVRLEQLYPLPVEEIKSALSHIPDGTPIFWVQEEPTNMGAWQYIKMSFDEFGLTRLPLRRISRPESASPSTGSKKMHKIEQDELVEEALTVDVGHSVAK